MRSEVKRWWPRLALVAIILVQTILYIVAGMNKAYFHMDEIYSYGLSNYDRVQVYETEDFYDTWHTGEYYDDYLTVNDDERWDLAPVYQNQKNDVHPPLFYLLLRIGMEMTPGEFSKWTGITLNVLIAAVNTVLIWVILRKLVGKENKWSVILLTAVVALGLATVSNVIYIRMYELLTLWVLLTAWLHLKLLDAKHVNWKLLLVIGLVALAGVLTQYYYVFFLVALAGYFTVHYAREKRWKEWRWYMVTLVGAAVISLMIWPWSVQHLFFSNRGGGVLERFIKPALLLGDLWQYLGVVDKYAFHYLLLFVILGLLLLGGKALARGEKLDWSEGKRQKFVMLLVPTLFYLLIVVAVSPFIELRYIAPVCGLLVVLVVLAFAEVLKLLVREGTWKKVMGVVLLAFVVMPVITGLKPDTLYTERAEVVSRVQDMNDVPALYVFKTGNDWVVLNDMLLLRELNNSYLLKDLEGNEEQVEKRLQTVLSGQDLSKGLLVFINDGQDNGKILTAVEEATGMFDVEHIVRVVTSDVYYIREAEALKEFGIERKL